MFRIGGIELSQELDTIHMFGNPSSDVVITIETDGTIRNGFASLTVWPRHDDALGLELFLKLGKEPRGRSETANEPDGFDHASRKDDLIPDGDYGSFYGGLK
jgi:hypothetical protein